MRKPRQQRSAHGARPSAPTDKAPGLTAANDPLINIQQQADQSRAVNALHAVQRRTSDAIQREVDTSISPFLPDYQADEQPSWQRNERSGVSAWAAERHGAPEYDDEGTLHNDPADSVPAWAQQDYKAKSKVTLMASVKDGMIGSIYFLDGRIRTTHSSGPTMSLHKTDEHNRKFNLDYDVAWRLFQQKNRGIYRFFYTQTDPSKPTQERQRDAIKYMSKQCDQWLAVYLRITPVDQLPDWVTPVTNADEAFDTDAADPPDNLTLFEVFTKVSNGKVQSWHPSRGIAAKFETDKQSVSVLKAALRRIDGVTDVNQRNAMFYEFIEHRIPDLATKIRKPNAI